MLPTFDDSLALAVSIDPPLALSDVWLADAVVVLTAWLSVELCVVVLMLTDVCVVVNGPDVVVVLLALMDDVGLPLDDDEVLELATPLLLDELAISQISFAMSRTSVCLSKPAFQSSVTQATCQERGMGREKTREEKHTIIISCRTSLLHTRCRRILNLHHIRSTLARIIRHLAFRICDSVGETFDRAAWQLADLIWDRGFAWA